MVAFVLRLKTSISLPNFSEVNTVTLVCSKQGDSNFIIVKNLNVKLPLLFLICYLHPGKLKAPDSKFPDPQLR
jgi:hypothetical protein